MGGGPRQEEPASVADESLARRARDGDGAALSLLLARWREPLLRFCRRVLRHEEDARDLSQDALLRTAQGIGGYDVSRPFAPWIYRIARNACLRHLEREARRSGAASAGERPVRREPAPDVLVSRREEVDRVRRAFLDLGEDDRRLLEMKLVRNLGNAEIAARLELTPGALRTRASRAVARIRQVLGGPPGEGRP